MRVALSVFFSKNMYLISAFRTKKNIREIFEYFNNNNNIWRHLNMRHKEIDIYMLSHGLDQKKGQL